MQSLVIEPRWIWDAEGGLRGDRFVIVEDGRIADVVTERPTLDAERIALPDGFLLPGFVNLHNHAFSAPLFRGLADDIEEGDLPGDIVYALLMPLGDIAAEALTEEEIGDVAEMALIETLKGGSTTIMDVWRLQQAPFIERGRRLGLRTYSCPYLFSTPKMDMTPDGRPVTAPPAADTGFDTVMDLFRRYDEGPRGRTRVGFGPHGLDTCTPELLTRIGRTVAEIGCPLTIHAAQSDVELQIVRERYGKSPIEHLRDMDLLRPGTVLAHCVKATDDELAIIRAQDAAVASCPYAFARSGLGVPFARFLDSGVRLGVGTDGVGLDMVAELRAAQLLAKVQAGRAGIASAEAMLRAATASGAAAIGRDDLGTLAKGAAADLLLFDLSGARYQPVWNPLQALLTNGVAADLHTLMVDGVALLRDRRVLAADEAAVTSRGAAAIRKVWDKARALGRIPQRVAARGEA
jgi:cytosine/adenosine deaminase-related metal-dependent hydrolase